FSFVVFFFQAEDGIRDYKVTGVQTCALPIFVGGAFLAQAVASLLDIEFYYAERFAPPVRDPGTLYPVQYRLPAGVAHPARGKTRSEERRVGNECGSRGWTYHHKEKEKRFSVR